MSATRRFGGSENRFVLGETVDDWGGKSLGLMKLSQFTNVPPGFAVSTDAYSSFLEEEEIDLSWIPETEQNPESVSAEVSAVFEEASLPYDVQQEVEEELQRLDMPVAARSSAVDEDGDDSSLAGVMESELHLSGVGEVLDGIKNVYMSRFCPEGIRYRQNQGLDEVGGVGVTVLEMVQPQAGGVMFTTRPSNPERMGIEAGKAPWDVVEPDEEGGVTDFYKVAKEDVPYAEGVVNYEHDNRDGGESVMTDEQLTQVTRIGQDIERSFDNEMDVEFAIDKETGEVYALQARPITEDINYEPEFELSDVEDNRVIANGEYFRNPGRHELPVVVLTDSNPMEGYRPHSAFERPNEEFDDGYVIASEHMNPDIINDAENAKAIAASEGHSSSHAATIAGDYGLTLIGNLDSNPEEELQTGDEVVVEYNGRDGFMYEPR